MPDWLTEPLQHPFNQRAIIAALWGPWARSGDANTRENWSIDFPDGSACHGFSAHPLGWLTHLNT